MFAKPGQAADFSEAPFQKMPGDPSADGAGVVADGRDIGIRIILRDAPDSHFGDTALLKDGGKGGYFLFAAENAIGVQFIGRKVAEEAHIYDLPVDPHGFGRNSLHQGHLLPIGYYQHALLARLAHQALLCASSLFIRCHVKAA